MRLTAGLGEALTDGLRAIRKTEAREPETALEALEQALDVFQFQFGPPKITGPLAKLIKDFPGALNFGFARNLDIAGGGAGGAVFVRRTSERIPVAGPQPSELRSLEAADPA